MEIVDKKTKDIYMYVMGAVIVISILVLLGMLIIYRIPPENKDLLNIVIGAMLAGFTTVIGYFFGSSLGSADKTILLDKTKEERDNEK